MKIDPHPSNIIAYLRFLHVESKNQNVPGRLSRIFCNLFEQLTNPWNKYAFRNICDPEWAKPSKISIIFHTKEPGLLKEPRHCSHSRPTKADDLQHMEVLNIRQ